MILIITKNWQDLIHHYGLGEIILLTITRFIDKIVSLRIT